MLKPIIRRPDIYHVISCATNVTIAHVHFLLSFFFWEVKEIQNKMLNRESTAMEPKLLWLRNIVLECVFLW